MRYLSKGSRLDHSRCRDAVETGKHAAIAENTDIVERCFYRGEHVANCDSVLSIVLAFVMFSEKEGAVQGRELDPAARLAWAYVG